MKKNNKVSSEICFVILPFGAFMNISRSSSPKTFVENQIGEKTFFIHKKVILVNIFGGIMKCDIIAQGVMNAVKAVKLEIPLVVRLEGTNVEQGRKMLAESGLPIVTASDLDDAAKQIVALAPQK